MDDLATLQFLKLERVHWWFEGRRRVFFSILRDVLGRREPLQILDVGCGVGGMIEELQEFGNPIGLELSEEMLRCAAGRGLRFLVRGSALELPFRAGALHLITAFDCIEHLDEDQEALRGFYRVIQPGGFLFLSVPAYQFLYAENDRVAQHKQRYTRRALVKRVREAGFEIVKATYVNALLFPVILPAVLLLKAKQRLLSRREPETNLSYIPARWLNRLLAFTFGCERHLLRFLSFPVGHSLVVVARNGRQPASPTS